MKLTSMFEISDASPTGDRPRDDELDLYGLTHPGRVRPENQDHFLLCTVHAQVVIHGTSLPTPDGLDLRGQRLATVMLTLAGSDVPPGPIATKLNVSVPAKPGTGL